MTTQLLLESDCNVGSCSSKYANSDVFSAGAAQRRIKLAIAALEQQEGSTVDQMFAALDQSSLDSCNNVRSGDEHDAGILDFDDMIVTTSTAAAADSDYDSEDDELQPHDQPLNIERIQ